MKTIQSSGKRKRSIARATLSQGTGKVRLNHQLIGTLDNRLTMLKLMEPIILAGQDVLGSININVHVAGGGIASQADAARLALSRGLVAWTKNKKLEENLLKYDRHLLVADVRRKEACKPNDSKARAKRQKSYR